MPGGSHRGGPVENAKNTLCRNVTIYGYCRHEKDGNYCTLFAVWLSYI